MSRFAGQVVDITQFMPKDGPQYDMIADQVMATNSMLRNTGTAAQAQFNTAGINSAATAQIGNLKGQMHITQGNLNATKILTGAEAAAAQLNAQGDAAQFGGMMSGLSGLAKGGLGFADEKGWFDKTPTKQDDGFTFGEGGYSFSDDYFGAGSLSGYPSEVGSWTN